MENILIEHFLNAFDWQILNGYFVMIFIQISTMCASTTIVAFVYIFIIGFFLFIIKMILESEDKLQAMDNYSHGINKGIPGTHDGNYLKRTIIDVAQFHSDVLE